MIVIIMIILTAKPHANVPESILRPPDNIWSAPTILSAPRASLEGVEMAVSEDGRCVEVDHQSNWVPGGGWHRVRAYWPDDHLSVMTRLRTLDELPTRFQYHIDVIHEKYDTDVEAAKLLGIQQERIRHATRQLDAPPLAETGLPEWLRIGLYFGAGIAVFAGGVALGLALGG